jgi:hypothetical protein
MKKFILSFLILTTMCSTMILGINAEEEQTNSDNTVYRLSDDEIEKATQEALQIELDKLKANKPMTRGYDDELMLLKQVGYKDKWSGYKPALDQPLKGTIFATKGSGFYWSDSKRTSGSVSLSVGIGGKTVSVSVGFQPGTVVRSSGSFSTIRNNQVNKRVKLYVKREYRITRFAVYTYKKYQGPKKAKFYKYQDVAVPVGRAFDIRNV